jgi:hypothetical protein
MTSNPTDFTCQCYKSILQCAGLGAADSSSQTTRTITVTTSSPTSTRVPEQGNTGGSGADCAAQWLAFALPRCCCSWSYAVDWHLTHISYRLRFYPHVPALSQISPTWGVRLSHAMQHDANKLWCMWLTHGVAAPGHAIGNAAVAAY